MGRASRGKALRRHVRTVDAKLDAEEPAADQWFKIGVCRACGRTGQITTAEGMCAPAPPGFKNDRAESCLARMERKHARVAR